ncbi:uncharacterized protein LOC144102219 [Amblyomma americanum]
MAVHRCVAEVHITESLLESDCLGFVNALGISSSELRRLVVCLVPGHSRAFRDLFLGGVIATMTELEEFAYHDRSSTPDVALRLFDLVRLSTRLRSLDLSATASFHPHLSAEFVDALTKNSSIKELSLSTKVMERAETRTREAMADYLRRNKILRKLVFAAPFENQVHAAELRSLVEPLFDNETLEELHLSISAPSAECVHVIAELVARNKSLIVLCVRSSPGDKSCRCPCIAEQRPASRCKEEFNRTASGQQADTVPHPRVHQSEDSSWARAFAGNRTLLELALDMSRLRSAECEAFLRALAASGTLRKVCLVSLPMKRLTKLLQVVRDAGPTLPRVHVGNLRVSANEVEALREFEISISKALPVAPLQVTHVRLTVDSDLTAHGLLARYLAGTRTLRRLELVGDDHAERVGHIDVALVRALESNKTVRRLELTNLSFSAEALEHLAIAVRRSKSICEFVFFPAEPESVHSFVVFLSVDFCENHTLVWVDFPVDSDMGFERFHIADVVRRNAMLVARAARFVTGASQKRCCAVAFEPVAKSPALVEAVRRLSPNERDAEAMVRAAQRGMWDMEGFMRTAGVVKERLVCRKRSDGRLQLDDLDADCLRLIRECLTLADIAAVSPDDHFSIPGLHV